MLQVENNTSFKVGLAVFPNQDAIDTLYVTIKATFSVDRERVSLADEQVPIVLADEYWGEAGLSSLKCASEIHLAKPSTDLVVVGDAIAPGGKAVQQLDVGLAVGSREKMIRVIGDRVWADDVIGLQITNPVPFLTMPLVYERAFGGVHVKEDSDEVIAFEARNPVGTGFRGKRSQKQMIGLKLPNLEDPNNLIKKAGDEPTPTCFGSVPPSWQPRVSFAGTYDEAWQTETAPYLPRDFDSRFLNAAHPDLTLADYLKGGEPVILLNMSPKEPMRFEIPHCTIGARVQISGSRSDLQANLETVIFEPGALRFSLVWRAAFECDKTVLKVEKVYVDADLRTNGH